MQNEDIIKVNAEGYVKEVISQAGPHIVQDMDGNQLNLNDPENDQEQLQMVVDLANKMSPIDLQYDGLRLFTPYSAQQMSDELNGLGIGDIKDNVLSLNSLHRLTGPIPLTTYLGDLGHGTFDFADDMTYLVSQGKNYPAPNPPGGFANDGTGGFVRFEGTNTLYNVYDAGNFMTGKAFQLIGMGQETLLKGANVSSVLTGKGKDTARDQQAVTNGFNYNGVQWKKK